MLFEYEAYNLEVINITDRYSLVWAEINLGALANNYALVKRLVGKGIGIMPVLKADAYGHGLERIAGFLNKLGVHSFAVSNVYEAVELRKAGLTNPILILGITSSEHLTSIFENNLTPMVQDLAFAQALNHAGERYCQRVKLNLRVSLGRGTLGTPVEQADGVFADMLLMPWLETLGVFTHLGSAYDSSPEKVQKDIERFVKVLDKLGIKKQQGVKVHAASSPAILRYPEAHFDLVRPGTCLYGLPSFENQVDIGLQQVMTLKARVVDIRVIPRGEPIGYCSEFAATIFGENTKVAVIPLGYADLPSFKFIKAGEVLIRGQRLPLGSKPFMDYCLVNINEAPWVQVGDEVVIFGTQAQETITIEEFAKNADINVVNCEVVCFLGKRVARKYI